MSLFPKYTPTKPAKPAKPEPTLATLATLAPPPDSNSRPVEAPLLSNDSEPEWQRDFCTACADLNGWRGGCPQSLDDCVLSRIQDAENVEQLGTTIGQGVKSDDVLQLWDGTIDELFKKPLWFICLAELIKKGKEYV